MTISGYSTAAEVHVLKLGGAVCDQADALAGLAGAWKRQGPGTQWVIVHGGGPQLTAALGVLGEDERRIDGLRVTSKAAVDTVADVLDFVGENLTTSLQALGVPAQQIRAADKAIEAVPKTMPAGLGRVGEFTAFRMPDWTAAGERGAAAANAPCATSGRVLIVNPVGRDAHGHLNVNADEVAVGIAKVLRARLLHLISDVPGVLDTTGAPIARMSQVDAQQAIAGGLASGGMAVKLAQTCRAVEAGLAQVRIGCIAGLQDPRLGTYVTSSMAHEVQLG